MIYFFCFRFEFTHALPGKQYIRIGPDIGCELRATIDMKGDLRNSRQIADAKQFTQLHDHGGIAASILQIAMLNKMRYDVTQRLQNGNLPRSDGAFRFRAQLLFIIFSLQLQPEGNIFKNIPQLLSKRDCDASLPIHNGADMLFGYTVLIASSLRCIRASFSFWFNTIPGWVIDISSLQSIIEYSEAEVN